MSGEYTNIKVAGRGVGELPVPFWIRILRMFSHVSLSLFFPLIALSIIGWTALATSSLSATGSIFAGALLLGFTFSWWALRTKAGFSAFKLKRTPAGVRFAGFRDAAEIATCVTAVAVLSAADLGVGGYAWKRCPLPMELRQITIQSASPLTEGLIPVYFWDYSTWIDPDWLLTHELVVPYEKGPPEHLLSRVIFRDEKSREPILELHGRRPRQYPEPQIAAMFAKPVPAPEQWNLLYKLEQEAGLVGHSGKPVVSRPDDFFFVRFTNGTRLLGVPWDEILSGSDKTNAGRFFFWGPDGSVFQVRCVAPCRAGEILSRTQFANDPRGSLGERVKFSGERLKKYLSKMAEPRTGLDRELYERSLTLLLVSHLTLDPRDPETYFHIGKLTRSRDTLQSMILYGRDTGMDAALRSELETRLNAF